MPTIGECRRASCQDNVPYMFRQPPDQVLARQALAEIQIDFAQVLNLNT